MANAWGSAWGGDTGAWLTAWGADGAAAVATCASATGTELETHTPSTTNGTNFSPDDDRLGHVLDMSPYATITGVCWNLRTEAGTPAANFRVGVNEVSGAVDTAEIVGAPDGVSADYDLGAITTASAGAFYWFPLTASLNVGAMTDAYVYLQREDIAFDASNYVSMVNDSTGDTMWTATTSLTVASSGTKHLGYKLYGTYATPVLSTPTDSENGSTSYTGTVSTDVGAGTLYWVVTQSATSPSAAQVQAGQDHLGAAADAASNQAVSATGTQNVAGGGLAASTAYYLHFNHLHQTLDSNVVSAAGFTTTAAPTDDGGIRFRGAFNRRRWSWGS